MSEIGGGKGTGAANDNCPHCDHAWVLHLERENCLHCGCKWPAPKPPPKLPTERELFIARVADLIHESVRENCDGYADEYGVVDGEIDFTAVAEHVIDEFNLERGRMENGK